MNTARAGFWLCIFSGVALIGIGLYFIFVRPAFLPEDLAYIGTAERIEDLIPRLTTWLHRVFTVLGGFISSTGIFAISSALRRLKGAATEKWLLYAAWFTSTGLMSAVNFAINSDFKMPLFALAVLWFVGIFLSSERTQTSI